MVPRRAGFRGVAIAVFQRWYAHGRRQEMTHTRTAWRAVAGTLLVLTSLTAQRAFREYPGREYENFPVPPDYKDKAEWVFGRLMYPPAMSMYGGRGFGRGGFGRGRFADWTQGYSSWTTD